MREEQNYHLQALASASDLLIQMAYSCFPEVESSTPFLRAEAMELIRAAQEQKRKVDLLIKGFHQKIPRGIKRRCEQ